jgi:GNAT superfamily N-acetyltransferase
MASIEDLSIAELEADAVAQACTLTSEAGWNQTSEDWAFVIAHGSVYGASDAAGRLVATAALVPYSGASAGQPGCAWVSLVIVTAAQRGRGVGTQMLHRCIATLRSRALTGLLDATPAGEKIYTPLGFQPVFGLQRWQGEGGGAARAWESGRDSGCSSERVRPLEAGSISGMAALDASVFGARRATLLANLRARAASRGFELSDASGYVLVRAGRVASYLGPVVATHARDAVALISTAIAATPGPIFVDVPDAQTQVAACLAEHNFRIQRPLLRMALGRDWPRGDPARMFAIAGPEYG